MIVIFQRKVEIDSYKFDLIRKHLQTRRTMQIIYKRVRHKSTVVLKTTVLLCYDYLNLISGFIF
jgi:hypothetical protein